VRRVLLVTLIALMATPGCGDRIRPEGLVERWLLALDQGAAGNAGRYAEAPTSRKILPGYTNAEPGQLDVVEVGDAIRTECSWEVPFRVVRTDERELSGFAIIPTCATAPIRPILDVEFGVVPEGSFPSEGATSFGSDRALVWVVAIGIGLGLVIVGEALMRLVRRRRPD